MLEEKKIITREKRTDAITAYQGSNKQLQAIMADGDVQQRIRTFSQDKKDEVYEALRLLNTINDAVIIIHGVLGTAAAELSFVHLAEQPIWYSTNLDERDTILGSDEKLRATVYRAYQKHHPKAIFIVSTSVVAINNDDISTVIMELEEELPVNIISIYTDGFKTKAEINGVDIVLHALGKYIVNEQSNKKNIVNIISITESKKSLAELERLITELGISYNILPQFSNIDDIKNAGQAYAALAVNEDEGNVFLEGLKEKAAVSVIKSRIPIGIKGTSAWLLDLAKAFKLTDKAANFIEVQEKAFAKYLEQKPFTGKKIFIALPTRLAAETALFLQSIGFELSGISIPYIDSLNKEVLNDLPDGLFIKIGEGQPFELINILEKTKPDFYIGAAGLTAFAANLGIIPISVENLVLYGYKGALELIEHLLNAQTADGFIKYLHTNSSLPYKKSWLRKSPDWHIKLEVK